MKWTSWSCTRPAGAKRLACGVRLNQPEAVALIATQLLELIRDGRNVAELMNLGRKLLGRRRSCQASSRWSARSRWKAPFATDKTSHGASSIASEDGDLALALYGSFLPVPEVARFGPGEDEPLPSGAYEIAPGKSS
ncbi:MAG: urease subunit gamma [Verrucomicrobiota bacterium]